MSTYGIRNGSAHLPRKRLGELLVEAGVIDAAQLRGVLAHQRRSGGRLGQCLVALRLATEDQVVRALSSRLDCPVAMVSALRPGPDLAVALDLVPVDFAMRRKILPIAVDSTCLTVAMADPTDVVAVDELSFRVGRRVRVTIAAESEITRALHRLYGGETAAPRGVSAAPVAPGKAAVDPHAARRDALLEALARVARGEESALFDRGSLMAALVRLLVRKGVVKGGELLTEISSS